MKTYEDFEIVSSEDMFVWEIEDELDTNSNYRALVNVAIYALMRSARQVEHLTEKQWNPDILTVTKNGIELYELSRMQETTRRIDFRNIPQALEISQMFV